MPFLSTVEVSTGPEPTAAVIWLHGLGADGHDFEPLVPELRLPADLAVRFVFPHAPVIPVTVNGGMRMRAWYDIRSFDAAGRADEAGVRASAAAVDALVDAEIERGIEAGRIVIAGFSQGGAVAVHVALTAARRYAGLIALSTYVPLPAVLASEAAASDRSLPIFAAHGEFDPVLPYALGRQSADAIEAMGYTVDWHAYPMAHGVCPDEIADVSAFLQSLLG